jgi:hypothetical protein
MSLTKATYSMVQGAPVNVLDFMSDAEKADVLSNTGSVDVTTPVAAAIASLGNIGVSGGGGVVIFPKGKYLCNIALVGTVNNSVGEYGIKLSGYGATLKGRVGDTSIITVNNCIPDVPDPGAGGSIYVNGTVIEGFTMDMSAMAVNGTAAIAAHRMYNSSINDIHVLFGKLGIYAGTQCYTWVVSNLNCEEIKVVGHDNENLTTSFTFLGLVANRVILQNVFSISFFGGVIQGNLDHFAMLENCQAITVSGMDLEAIAPAVIYNFGANCRYITSIGNQVTGVSLSDYENGFAANSNFFDRPGLPSTVNNVGVYGRAASQAKASVSTTPTPIYIFRDSTQATALVLVTGDNGTAGFQDLIMVFGAFVTTVKSQDIYGSPPARTYTSDVGSNSLLMSVASGTHLIRPVLLEFLMSVT